MFAAETRMVPAPVSQPCDLHREMVAPETASRWGSVQKLGRSYAVFSELAWHDRHVLRWIFGSILVMHYLRRGRGGPADPWAAGVGVRMRPLARNLNLLVDCDQRGWRKRRVSMELLSFYSGDSLFLLGFRAIRIG
jgi:hypothetical protein